MKIGAGSGSPLPARLGEECRIEERANARRAAFEVLDIERRIEAPQCIAAGIVRKGVGVLPALFKGLAEREMQLRRIGAVDARRSRAGCCMAAISASLKE